MAHGDPKWNWGDSSSFQYDVNWNQYTTSAGATTVPYYLVPAPVVEPEPVDDSALGWLRGQVAEMCDLARSA